MKQPPSLNNFGKRLAVIRKTKGLSQRDLAQELGISNRVVAYYEAQSQHIPANLLVPIAKVLKVSIDELLGAKEFKDHAKPENKSLLKRFKKLEQLNPKEQKAIFKMIDIVALKNNNHKNMLKSA